MSRLAEAEAKLEVALKQLEAALASRPTVDGNSGTAYSASTKAGKLVDHTAIIAEIGRIDEQLSTAMQMLDRVRHASGGEGGTA